MNTKPLSTNKPTLLPTIIQLHDNEFSTFLDLNRQLTYKDASIIINEAYLLRTNSVQLALNSQFFRTAFSSTYHCAHK
jgi:hypothetical protein